MAFNNKNLSVIAYANHFTLWHYTTQDYVKDIQEEYFPKGVLDLMNVGDIMIVNGGDTTDIRFIKTLVPFVLEQLNKLN